MRSLHTRAQRLESARTNKHSSKLDETDRRPRFGAALIRYVHDRHDDDRHDDRRERREDRRDDQQERRVERREDRRDDRQDRREQHERPNRLFADSRRINLDRGRFGR